VCLPVSLRGQFGWVLSGENWLWEGGYDGNKSREKEAGAEITLAIR
jgi:hypothetical protein